MGESAVAAPSTNSDGHLGGMEDLSGENPAAATPMAPPIEYWDRRLATSYVQLLVDQQRLSLGTDVVERYDLDNLLYRDALRQAEREGYDVSHLHGPTGEAGDYHGRHRLEDLRPSAVTEDTWESAGVLGRLALIPEPEVVAAASHGQSDEVEAPPVARRRRTARAVGVLAM
ncbi:MAG TPA: hypothetical protein VLE99_00700, partial [Candidatus Saccharimonadales bacterium]|nr:hypothetical protein [Candidatus Saccharimonadales bacterium]